MFLVGPQLTGSFFKVGGWGHPWNSSEDNLTGDGLLSSGQTSREFIAGK
jgi:hypothetical protein